MSEHNLVQNKMGQWSCRDSLGMACSGSTWGEDEKDERFRQHLDFMESLEPGNIEYRWAVRRYDTGDGRPMTMEFEKRNNEAVARQFYESYLRLWHEWRERNPGKTQERVPELLRTPLIWMVVS